jgi:hypothetical protein
MGVKGTRRSIRYVVRSVPETTPLVTIKTTREGVGFEVTAHGRTVFQAMAQATAAFNSLRKQYAEKKP